MGKFIATYTASHTNLHGVTYKNTRHIAWSNSPAHTLLQEQLMKAKEKLLNFFFFPLSLFSFRAL